MVLPGHLAGGYLTAKAVLYLAHASFSPAETTALMAIGTLAGEAPDIDLLFFYLHQKYSAVPEKRDSHRSFITHTPAFWLLISMLIVGTGWIGSSLFTETLGWLLLAGSWSHFLLDSFEYGIRWLWPFSDKRFCVRNVVEPVIPGPQGNISYYWKLLSKVYYKRVTFYLEGLVVLIALWVAFHG